ncbi:hypothetical protein [Paracoccus marinaquae]|uniref:Uncharacterized protein n=1 Tax=Paracoccus marinaquae TaxID=2841926 RepID=A0ABS6AGU0_9RHOB|nr:hypothetical protein [Paracoccus marinaquae]MBU3029813.1 hypothetical protein [Paracoccus marinaquae]
MTFFARMQIDWRWPVLFFGSAALTTTVTITFLSVLANVSGTRLPYKWNEIAMLLAVGATARSVLPSLAVWMFVIAICRRLRTEPAGPIIASAMAAVIGWLNAVWLAWSIFGPRIFGDLPILAITLALPLTIAIGLALGHLIYHQKPAEALP